MSPTRSVNIDPHDSGTLRKSKERGSTYAVNLDQGCINEGSTITVIEHLPLHGAKILLKNILLYGILR